MSKKETQPLFSFTELALMNIVLLGGGIILAFAFIMNAWSAIDYHSAHCFIVNAFNATDLTVNCT